MDLKPIRKHTLEVKSEFDKKKRSDYMTYIDMIIRVTMMIKTMLFILRILRILRIIEIMIMLLVGQPAHDDVIKWKHFPRYWPCV